MHYQLRLDKIFAKGSLWKHRTLRTLFDPYSSEYDETSLSKKLEILQIILRNGFNLNEIVFDYKQFYKEENKQNVIDNVEEGLSNLLSYTVTNSINEMGNINAEMENINVFLKKILIESEDDYFLTDKQKIIFTKLKQDKKANFNSDWNYLMLLINYLEQKYQISKIEISTNYCRFEFGDELAEQDKGMELIDAVFSVCYKTIERFSKDETPKFSRGVEPFDEIDLK